VRTGHGRRFTSTLALIVALGTGAVAAPQALAQPSVKTGTGRRGLLAVRGVGWAGNGAVVCEVFDTGRGWVLAGRLPTDGVGTFGGALRAPNDLPPGAHVLRCRQSGMVARTGFTTPPRLRAEDVARATVRKPQSNANNDVGQVAGIGQDSQGHYVAWLNSGGQVTPIAGLGGSNTEANGINDVGQVTGTADLPGGIHHAFIWTQVGGPRDLGTLAGTDSEGFANNDAGQVAGDSQVPTSLEAHAALWNPLTPNGATGTWFDLGTLGGASSTAFALNGSGEVAGASRLSAGSETNHAFLWKPGSPNGATGRMFDLGTLGGASSQAFGLDTGGDVVGISQTKAGVTHPFLWTARSVHGTSGRMTDLGTLGGTGANAYAVNDAGEVVGSSYLEGDKAFHAFLSSGGRLFDLNRALPRRSGWVLDAANGIDDVGQIVGWGTFHGRQHAFQLSPVTTLGPLTARIAVSATSEGLAAAGPGPATSLVQGGTAQWQNRGPGARTVGDASGMGLFGSPAFGAGTGYAFRFDAAGAYSYSTTGRPARGTVRVPMEAAPAKGTRRTTFQLYWCFCKAPAGYVFDVQLKRPGAESFTSLATGTTAGALGVRFKHLEGRYRLRARIRRKAIGKASGWSPVISIRVSS
jgi:probable HAF family extracellular repeat protein